MAQDFGVHSFLKYVNKKGKLVTTMFRLKGQEERDSICSYCKFNIPDPIISNRCEIRKRLNHIENTMQVTVPVYECAKFEEKKS